MGKPRKHSLKYIAYCLLIFVCLTFVSCGGTPKSAKSAPKNIILFIGDGMGFEQVKAASMYSSGSAGMLSFEKFPYQTEMTTYSANAGITDSAAAGTAIATGQKVNNGVISMAIPGNQKELLTLLEFFKSCDKSVGLVTTTYITDATPAAFGAHEPSRGNLAEIANDYLNQTRPDVIFGGGGNGITLEAAVAAGYTVVSDLAELKSIDTEDVSKVSGQFGTTHLPYELDGLGSLPHLSQMTEIALKILDNNPKGFFLVVEGGKIDHAGHANDLSRNIFETLEFANTVQLAFELAASSDTLIIVTADHECGGLSVIQNNGKGNYPSVRWSSGSHTAANVPVYAWGVGAEDFSEPIDNTDIFRKITDAFTASNIDMTCANVLVTSGT